MPGQTYSPFQRFMGLNQIDEQQQQPVTIQGLRDALNKKLGIEEGSTFDAPLGAAAAAAESIPSRDAVWNRFAKVQQPPQIPYAGGKMGPFAPPAAMDGLAQAGHPTMSPPPGPLKGGRMSFAGGNPNLSGTPGALDNFAALSKQFTPPSGISTEELYRGAYADPASRAPGAPQAFAAQLSDRLGDTEFERQVKMQPTQVAGINAAGGVAQQQEASKGAANVANINQGGLAARYGALTDLMAGGGMTPGSHISMPGGGGFTVGQGQTIPAAVQTQLTTAINQLQNQGATSGIMGNQPSAAKTAFDMALSNVMRYVPNADNISAFAHDSMSHPELAQLSWDQILMKTGETDLTPDEQMIFRAHLLGSRGF